MGRLLPHRHRKSSFPFGRVKSLDSLEDKRKSIYALVLLGQSLRARRPFFFARVGETKGPEVVDISDSQAEMGTNRP